MNKKNRLKKIPSSSCSGGFDHVHPPALLRVGPRIVLEETGMDRVRRVHTHSPVHHLVERGCSRGGRRRHRSARHRYRVIDPLDVQ